MFICLLLQEAGQVNAGAGAGVWGSLHRVCWDATHREGGWMGGQDVLRAFLQLLPGNTPLLSPFPSVSNMNTWAVIVPIVPIVPIVLQ